MNLSLIILGLVGIALIAFAYSAYLRWRMHMHRQTRSQASGWRYWHPEWRWLFYTEYRIVGTTPNGIIWEVRRVQDGKRFYFRWSSYDAELPFGTLYIWPQAKIRTESLPTIPHLHSAHRVGSDVWREQYGILTTHDHLGERFVNETLEESMLAWPSWSQPGAFERLNWQGRDLEIYGRYQPEWEIIDRLVELGTLLTKNLAKRPIAKKE